jgi:L-threonylcarbamoyladenylate synthase
MRIVPFTTAAQIDAALPAVVEHLGRDRLVAYPTETVYGFGGAVTAGACAALRRLKRREPHHPFLLLVDGADGVAGVTWSATARTLARLFWPGPLTIVLPAEPGAFPAEVVSGDGGVALRASPHAGALALIRAWRAPLTSTSANATGRPPARDTDEVVAALGELDAEDVFVLDGGALPPSRPSTVVACQDSFVRVLREGAVDSDTLRNRLQGTGIDVG